MKPTFNDKLIAYFTLFSGLAISGIAEYYSIMGLIAIYPMATIPIIIMGIVLGIGKISGTVWLKQNWEWSPFFLKAYVLPAIFILMMITSLGVFGFLSKAHSDQSLVSGDVQSKIAIYDEKIRTEKENIDAARKALKQMDESVDQTMARSDSERGAERAVQIRRQQQAERARLQKDIIVAQGNINKLNEERAPIAAEVRKVEAEVGPIKYIAHLLYGADPDANILEKAVIWVTVLIVIVLDPLAVVLLLASQYSFQRFREYDNNEFDTVPVFVADVGEKPTAEEKAEINDDGFKFLADYEDLYPDPPGMKLRDAGEHPKDTFEYEQQSENKESKEHHPDTHPYLRQGFKYPEGYETVGPMVARPDPVVEETTATTATVEVDAVEETATELSLAEKIKLYGYSTENGIVRVGGDSFSEEEFNRILHSNTGTGYVQNEEQTKSGVWNRVISEQEYRQKAEQNIKNELNNNPNNAS